MSLIDPVNAFFEEMGWEATRLEKVPVVTTGLQLPTGEVEIFAHAHDEQNRILIYVRPRGLDIPAERMLAVAEFLTRANYGLPLGNFEMDLQDGEINFKNSIEIVDCQVSVALVRPMVIGAVETVNRYLPGLQQVVAGTAPAQAIAAVEAPQ